MVQLYPSKTNNLLKLFTANLTAHILDESENIEEVLEGYDSGKHLNEFLYINEKKNQLNSRHKNQSFHQLGF